MGGRFWFYLPREELSSDYACFLNKPEPFYQQNPKTTKKTTLKYKTQAKKPKPTES